ncbi:MAG: VIT domain-containing protein, partial [Alphaproteobacteria bacterium]
MNTQQDTMDDAMPPSVIVAKLFDDLVAALEEARLSIAEGRIEDRFRAVAVSTEIVGDLAITTVEEEFFNPASDTLEGLYRVSVPENAVLERFA